MTGPRPEAGCIRRSTLSTTADRFGRVDAIFDAALDLPTAEQIAFVERACGDDAELCAQVLRLLRAHQQSEGFLGAPALQFATPFLEPGDILSAVAPERVGHFRIVGVLGRGGMGEVYLAQRDDGQFEQRVALKLIQRGAGGLVRRFLDERRILARLEHPGIARLVDGGITPDGLPYFAMELVEGEPIDRYCERDNVSTERRLELFGDVCDAVSYAHQHLVIHRDLKPSNILVTAEGKVKLLDFGIAKVLGAAEASDDRTRTGMYMMTPEFAAPEQLRGEPVSTATDVYALGVLLYLLLTGKRPYDLRGRSPAEVERIVADLEPPRPSSVVPKSQSRLLRGDLDAIVLKALRKEPTRRYASVAELAADLERHRFGLPVQARPNSSVYRLRKFARRNGTAVAAAIVTLLALVAATAFSAAQMREAQQQRDAALSEIKRQQAMLEIQDVLASDSRATGARPLTAIERIELAELILTRRFRTEPWLVTEVLSNLASRLFDMGEGVALRRMLGRARVIASDAGLARQLALVDCQRAYSFVYDDQYDSARVALTHAQAALARAGGAVDVANAACLNAEGQLLVAEDHADSALVLHNRAVVIAQNDRNELFRLQTINDLAGALRAAGRTRDATRYYRQIVAQLDERGYSGTDILPGALAWLTSSLNELGEIAVFDSVTGAIVRSQQALQGNYSSGLLNFLYGLGKLRLGELDSADVWIERAQQDTTEGAGYNAYLPPALTQLRLEQGRLAEARRHLSTLPSGTLVRRANAAWFTARLRYAEGDKRGASGMLEDSLRAMTGNAKPKPALAMPYVTAAEWRLAAGDARAADSLAAIGIAAAAVDSLALQRSAYAGRAELVRARALFALGDRRRASQEAERAGVALANGLGPHHFYTREAQALRAAIPLRPAD